MDQQVIDSVINNEQVHLLTWFTFIHSTCFPAVGAV